MRFVGFRYLAAQWTHSIFDDFIIKQLPPIVTWVLSFAYVIRLAKVKDIYSDNGGQVSRMHTVLPSYRPTVLPSYHPPVPPYCSPSSYWCYTSPATACHHARFSAPLTGPLSSCPSLSPPIHMPSRTPHGNTHDHRSALTSGTSPPRFRTSSWPSATSSTSTSAWSRSPGTVAWLWPSYWQHRPNVAGLLSFCSRLILRAAPGKGSGGVDLAGCRFSLCCPDACLAVCLLGCRVCVCGGGLLQVRRPGA